MEMCVLASGSSGNSVYVATGSTRILVDAGLSARQIALRLEQIGATPESINGICLSHEHSDHTAGVHVFQKRHALPVYANQGTIDGLRRTPKSRKIETRIFQTGASFLVGDIVIDPFTTPHDAFEPVGFRLEADGIAVGIVTDIGVVTALVCNKLKDCSAIVVEANHDEDLLREAIRPWPVKQRIRSRQGHLSNIDAARLIAECASPQLRHVFLAHLSSDCNTPETARQTIAGQLRLDGLRHLTLEVSTAASPTQVWHSG